MWTAADIYYLGVWQTMGPHDPDVLGRLQPHARRWLRAMVASRFGLGVD